MKRSDASANNLQKHIAGTYFSLRLGMGLLAAALPVVLWLGGRLFDHEPLRCSMSAYYYSPNLRDAFVGILCAVGVFLYLYKGFSQEENWALNLAGALAVGIAMVPTAPGCSGGVGVSVHGAFAVLFFLSIAYVSIFRAADTLSLIRDTKKSERLRTVYRGLGGIMIVSPAIAVVLSSSLQPGSVVFFIELVAVWTFAAYWLVKSRELSVTDAEELALEARLKLAAKAPPTVKRAPGRVVQVGATDEEEAVIDNAAPRQLG